MNRKVLAVLAIVVAGLILAAGVSSIAASGKRSVSSVYEFNPFPEHGDQVEGAAATLRSTDNGVRVKLNTGGLEANDAVTLWWVIFNNPENCEAYPGECTLGDLLGNPAGVGSEVVYADGDIVGANGKVHYDAFLAKGAAEGGWFGNGLQNPEGAEIHVIVHTHGQVIPGQEAGMTNTWRAGCADGGMIAPGHPAYEDGTPGPNTCIDLQFAVFQQD